MFSWRVHFYGQCNSDLLHIPLGAFKISSGHVRQRPRIFFSPSQETVRKALIGHHFENSNFWKWGKICNNVWKKQKAANIIIVEIGKTA